MVPILFLTDELFFFFGVVDYLLELQRLSSLRLATRVYQLQLAISEAAWRENTSHWTPSLATNDYVIM